MTRSVVANLGGEAALAGESLPRSVRERLAAAGSLLRVLAGPGDRLWLEGPLSPDCLAPEAGWPRPELVTGALPAGDAVGWMAAPPFTGPVGWAGPGSWSLPSPSAARCYVSRRFGHELAARLGVALPGAAGVSDLEGLDAVVASGVSPWVLKPAWSAAGRGLVRGEGPVRGAARAEAGRLLGRDGWLEVQPWLERRADYGCAGWVDEGGRVAVRGAHRLEVDDRGRFRGIVIGPEGARPAGLSEDQGAQLDAVCRAAGEALAAAGHRGPFALDACLDAGGRLRPLLELNARLSFGAVARVLVRDGRHDLGDTVRLRFGRGAVPGGDGVRRLPLLHPDPSHQGGGTSAWLEPASFA